MRRISLVLAAIMVVTLVLAACGGRKDAAAVVKDLDQVVGKMASYQGTGRMTLHTGQQPLEYQVEVWYQQPSFYRIKLTNEKQDITQIVLRNNDGVFVLTPQLNKSFRFQSNWPENQGQVYLYQTLANSILADKDRQFTMDKGAYVFDVVANYQNSALARQKIWLDQKSLKPMQVQVSDASANLVVEVEFSKFEFGTKFDKDSFDMQRNMTSMKLPDTMPTAQQDAQGATKAGAAGKAAAGAAGKAAAGDAASGGTAAGSGGAAASASGGTAAAGGGSAAAGGGTAAASGAAGKSGAAASGTAANGGAAKGAAAGANGAGTAQGAAANGAASSGKGAAGASATQGASKDAAAPQGASMAAGAAQGAAAGTSATQGASKDAAASGKAQGSTAATGTTPNGSAAQGSAAASASKELDFGIITPHYTPQGVKQQEISQITLGNEKALLLRYSGTYNYNVVELKPEARETYLVPGDIVDLGYTIAVLSGDQKKTLIWTYNGVEYRLSTADLPNDEMIHIAQSVQGQIGK